MGTGVSKDTRRISDSSQQVSPSSNKNHVTSTTAEVTGQKSNKVRRSSAQPRVVKVKPAATTTTDDMHAITGDNALPIISQAKKDNTTIALKTLKSQGYKEIEDTVPTHVKKTANKSKVYPQHLGVDKFNMPSYEGDAVVLESFLHNDGAEYQCMFQSGKRYYLDSWETKDWLPFPDSWRDKGVIITNTILHEDDESPLVKVTPDDSVKTSRSLEPMNDDREGYLDHPTRGRVNTYIFEERRNIHCFYDKKMGNWLQLPISWELHCDSINALMNPIQETLPEWKDRHDVLASLRASNYNPHLCIDNYLAIAEKAALVSPKDVDDQKLLADRNKDIVALRKSVKSLNKELDVNKKKLNSEIQLKEKSDKLVEDLEDKLNKSEAESRTLLLENDSLKRERDDRSLVVTREKKSKMTIDAAMFDKLRENAALILQEYIGLKNEVTKRFAELRDIAFNIVEEVASTSQEIASQLSQVYHYKELYRKESLQRKILYNTLQELRGNIRVFARCRNVKDGCSLQFPMDNEISIGKKCFKFDRVFQPSATQTEVFEEVFPVITSCLDGYNVCILAYGQTNSGKTYTMQGSTEDPGVNIRSIKELLRICDERENVTHHLSASIVEIYNETIQDLLTSDTKTLELRALGNNVMLPTVKKMQVKTFEDIENIFKIGTANRKTASTKMNSQSSRSHLICTLTVECTNETSGITSIGTLTLCDLAGSERVSKTDASGKRLIEASSINKSLSSLGQIFNALRTGQLHVPYRNSKLTHLLQPSLGGDAKACIFVNVSPDQSNVSESVSTLEFGSNAKQVALGQAKPQTLQKKPAQSNKSNNQFNF